MVVGRNGKRRIWSEIWCHNDRVRQDGLLSAEAHRICMDFSRRMVVTLGSLPTGRNGRREAEGGYAMNPSFCFDDHDVIRVKRDWLTHSWAVAVGGHWVPLPWKDTAD